MQLPADKKSETVSELYVIPVERTDALLGESFEVPRPNPLEGNPDEKVVRIQKLGEEQWILLEEAPGVAWPRIRAFLISNHIGVEREDASTGKIETAWLTFTNDTARRHMYRFRVEQGVQRNSSEIYVQQMGYKRDPDANVEPPVPAWPTKSMDAERETLVLSGVGEVSGVNVAESSVGLAVTAARSVS